MTAAKILDFPIAIHSNIWHNIWNKESFQKNNWGGINYLIGPNGTGKTFFIQELIDRFKEKFTVRYISSDRLAMWSRKGNVSSPYVSGIENDSFETIQHTSNINGTTEEAFILLKENADIELKVKSFLSQLSNRQIVIRQGPGRITPIVFQGDVTYNFNSGESHGFKSLIMMLTLLYDRTKELVFIDEPELHLHPQFQNILTAAIRKISLEESNRFFFISTHSPNCVDIRTIEDLKNCILFQINKAPQFIQSIDDIGETAIKRLLPRINIHHKQLFFSGNPIFVEGYTDQHIFSLLKDILNKNDPMNSIFIDVSGKGELGTYYQITNHLSLNRTIITDLDAIINGNLIKNLASSSSVKDLLMEKLGNSNLDELLTGLEALIDNSVEKFLNQKTKNSILCKLEKALLKTNKRRYYFLIGIQKFKKELSEICGKDINSIYTTLGDIINALKTENVIVLSEGQLENYLRPDMIDINDNEKKNIFQEELNYLIENYNDPQKIKNRYSKIIDIVNEIILDQPSTYHQDLEKKLMELIQKIQLAFKYDKISSLKELTENETIHLSSYKSLFEIISFECNDKKFSCDLRIVVPEIQKTINLMKATIL